VREKSAYSSSGNTGKIIVEVVIGGRHCSCALSKDGDLSWFVISTMAENEGLWTYLARISAKRCDVLLHPFKSDTLIMQAEVEGTSLHHLRSLREAERPKTIIDRDVQDRCGAHVAYIAVLVGRTHVQYSRTPRKKQRGPSLRSKCIYSYGPITKCCICSRMGQLYAVAFKIFACIGPSRA
jgi:hypothetical protein